MIIVRQPALVSKRKSPIEGESRPFLRLAFTSVVATRTLPHRNS